MLIGTVECTETMSFGQKKIPALGICVAHVQVRSAATALLSRLATVLSRQSQLRTPNSHLCTVYNVAVAPNVRTVSISFMCSCLQTSR